LHLSETNRVVGGLFSDERKGRRGVRAMEKNMKKKEANFSD
jgi:hypothetical protein